jgi:hypothetical protein
MRGKEYQAPVTVADRRARSFLSAGSRAYSPERARFLQPLRLGKKRLLKAKGFPSTSDQQRRAVIPLAFGTPAGATQGVGNKGLKWLV